MCLFELQNLTFTYPEQDRPALQAVTLDLHPGEFVTLCGPSGCGKSTLLRQLKPSLTPHGVQEGAILFQGKPLSALDLRTEAACIGFVRQSPDNQLVTDQVWHELAFGLECLGYDTPTIRRRVAETASFFGIQSWFHKKVSELSGGQKQLLNLASVMVLSPTVLILDEPTSQLDPIAASEFLATLGRLNRELGITVLLTEHRLEEAFPLSTTVVAMEAGRILCTGTPTEVGLRLREAGHPMFLAMPAPMRVWAAVDSSAPCPVTVREGRDWLADFSASHALRPFPEEAPCPSDGEAVLEADNLWFRYQGDSEDTVKGLTLSLGKGSFTALLGGNGTGKTTVLRLLSGLCRPRRGAVRTHGRLALLPQNPQTLFVKKTVGEDLLEVFHDSGLSRQEQESRISEMIQLCGLAGLLDRHPFDLSGGEQQRAALAKVLLLDPHILLLDEPTKGMDAEFKQVLGEILRTLLRRGVTLLMVSHDTAFCARYAHSCALFFDGNIVSQGSPRSFFSGNSFYTTAANRMSRSILPGAVTPEDIITACGGTLPPERHLPDSSAPLPPPKEDSPDRKPPPLPLWRKLLGALSGLFALGLLTRIFGTADLTAPAGADGLTSLAGGQVLQYAAVLLSLLVFALSLSRPGKRMEPPRTKRQPPSKSIRAAARLILLLIPLTLFIGQTCLSGRNYYVIALLILLECMLPFFLLFEGRRPQARELVLLAALCAMGVAGRAVFFMLPQFKPVTALTVLSGAVFGGETGFLVGAMTMLASNALFSQGPWTPWQMFCMGIIGFLAGVLFRSGRLRRDRLSLCLFGALSALLLYGGIMNPASALLWTGELNREILIAYYFSGFPMDCIHAFGTWVFLWFGAEPLLEKLERIKRKYGLLED